MENPYLIPIIVALVTGMALGAIYLLVLRAKDGNPEAAHEDAADEAAHEAELSNLLNIVGRREGARSVITLG